MSGVVIQLPFVPQPAFLGASWGMISTATVCLAVRLYARITRMRRLYWDDAFAIAPWVLMLGAVIMFTSGWVDIYYRMTMLTAGQQVSAIPTADELDGAFITMLIYAIFFYVSLMLVKISFLLFFRHLAVHGGRETRSKGQRIYWWIVLALCFVTVVVQIGTIQFPCFVNGFMYTYMHCTANPEIVRGMWISVSLGFFFDVLTDVLIIVIPLRMVWNLKLPRRKKAALISLFSLAIITIAFAIARLTTLSSQRWGGSGLADPINLWFWNYMEATVALIVVNLASFRPLYTKSTKRSKPASAAAPRTGGSSTSTLSKLLKWTSPRSNTRNSGHNSENSIEKSPTGLSPPLPNSFRPDLEPEVSRKVFVNGSPSMVTEFSRTNPPDLERGEAEDLENENGVVRAVGYQVGCDHEGEDRKEVNGHAPGTAI